MLFCCCNELPKTLPQGKTKIQSIIIDSTLRDTIIKHIEFGGGKNDFSFTTPIEARFFSNGQQTDSIIENNFSMISRYSSWGDTLDLVAHVGNFETSALLIRFLKGKPSVFFLRAPHDIEESKYFKVNTTDTFSHSIEVKPVSYELKLSHIPDTIGKQIVYGQIDMESNDYYDSRDSAENKNKVHMKFYLRSKYKKFNY